MSLPDSISPEDFVGVLGLFEPEVEWLGRNSIFTVRQLAEAVLDSQLVDSNDRQRVHALQSKAMSYIEACVYEDAKRVHQKSLDRPMWGYTYGSTRCVSSINNDQTYKSPYVLFNEYMNSPPDTREQHPWKDVYYAHFTAARDVLQIPYSPSDPDVFSYLIWRGTRTVGKLDTTAVIPFLWDWMPAELHGSSLRLDSFTGAELGNSAIADRYTYPIAINLTKLVHEFNGSVFSVELKPRSNMIDDLTLLPIQINQIQTQKERFNLWDHYNAGDNCYYRVPHGCILTPTGEIPRSCLQVFDPKPIIEY